MKTCFIILLGSLLFTTQVAATGEPGLKSNTVKVETSATGLVIYTKSPGKLQFYLFDVEGKLVRKSEISSDKHEVNQLEKGCYLYSIFSKDHEIYSGKVIVK